MQEELETSQKTTKANLSSMQSEMSKVESFKSQLLETKRQLEDQIKDDEEKPSVDECVQVQVLKKPSITVLRFTVHCAERATVDNRSSFYLSCLGERFCSAIHCDRLRST